MYFSPNGGATTAIVDEINNAKKSVFVLAYSFTSPQILKALAEAKARGVDVEIVLDKSNATAKYSGATYVKNAGIPTFIDYQHAIAHNKVMVIDGDIVITGSFNFTRSAEDKNSENVLVLRSAALAEVYTAEWVRHERHSEAAANSGQ